MTVKLKNNERLLMLKLINSEINKFDTGKPATLKHRVKCYDIKEKLNKG